jgi:pilus assembly protein CpaB
MKNIKAFALLFLALVAGLGAAIYAAGWVSQQRNFASNKVVVAAVDIQLGSRLNPEMLTMVDWPREAVPPGAFSDSKSLQDRVVKTGLLRGEAILEGKLAPAGTQGGLSAVIAEGKRAMTVRVNDVVGVAGFALPGNYVDIIVSTQKESAKSEHNRNISKIVLERILVLAVAQEVGRDDTKPRVVNAVTLEVTPDQAEKLDLARSVGTLSLALRNQIDPKPSTTEGATKISLLDESLPPPVAPKAPVRKVAARAPVPTVTCVGLLAGVRGSSECY